MNSLDDLELELRKLPGVKAAGFDERDDMLLVQLHVGDEIDSPEHPVPIEASRIVARHVEERTAVEIVRWRTIPAAARDRGRRPLPAPAPAPAPPPPPAPDAATPEPEEPSVPTRPPTKRSRRAAGPACSPCSSFPDTDELEVHLILDGRRTIGRVVVEQRAARRGRSDARRGRASSARPFEPTPLWARQLDSDEDERVVVAVALGGVVDDAPIDYGIAAGASPIDAAARSTLDALNRRLAQVL